jgi:GNAT superfamily N-acetyltransferase
MTQPRYVIRAVEDNERAALLAHFLALDSEDRRLRFGNPLADELITHYVDALDFSSSALIGAFDAEGRIAAVAHIAFGEDERAEIGLSVRADARGQGLGTRIFKRAASLARARRVKFIDMHFLSENMAMQHIARKAGMVVHSHAAETDAHFAVPAGSRGGVRKRLASGVAANQGEAGQNETALASTASPAVPAKRAQPAPRKRAGTLPLAA